MILDPRSDYNFSRSGSHGMEVFKGLPSNDELDETIAKLVPLIYLLFAKLISEFGYFVAVLAYAWGAICTCRSLSEVRLKLVGDGIESSAQMTTSKYDWQAFTDISQSGDLVILWLDRAQAVIVPERAFANEEMHQTFINTVRGHLPRVPS
jgi:hypothetical protein